MPEEEKAAIQLEIVEIKVYIVGKDARNVKRYDDLEYMGFDLLENEHLTSYAILKLTI